MRLFVICCAWLAVSALVPAAAWAPWGTGESVSPARSDEQVCRNGVTWQLATVSPPVVPPGRLPQSITTTNVVAREVVSTDVLAGPVNLILPLQPLYVDPDEVQLDDWAAGYPGIFTHHTVQTLQFKEPVQPQSQIRVTWDQGNLPQYVFPVWDVTTCHLMDLKPDAFPNRVRPRVGAVQVAVLSTPDFKARSIRSGTVRFGTGGERAEPRDADLVDVDGDGDSDLLMRFRTRDTGIACDSHAVKLEAKRDNGKTLNGEDSVMPVGC